MLVRGRYSCCEIPVPHAQAALIFKVSLARQHEQRSKYTVVAPHVHIIAHILTKATNVKLTARAKTSSVSKRTQHPSMKMTYSISSPESPSVKNSPVKFVSLLAFRILCAQ